MQSDKKLVAAASASLVLAILSEGESYGYAILKRVRALSDGELKWSDGMLYPLLHRLHRLGYVTQEWRTRREGRRRRYYAVTDEGQRAFKDPERQWPTVTRILGTVFGDFDLMTFARAKTSLRRLAQTSVPYLPAGLAPNEK